MARLGKGGGLTAGSGGSKGVLPFKEQPWLGRPVPLGLAKRPVRSPGAFLS